MQSLARLQARQDQFDTRQQDVEIKVQELEQTVGEMKATLAEETPVKLPERSWVGAPAEIEFATF